MRRPLVMGIINLTPDSFSDGGEGRTPAWAAGRARALTAEGADWLDVGGESTRPGAASVGEAEEIDRVVPAIAAIRAACATPLSIDTMKPAVARAAIAAGANMWNDVLALRAEGAVEAAADLKRPVVLMHMQGTPATMQDDPRYGDVVEEVADFLTARAQTAAAAGVDARSIWIDPGFGFGKTAAHNLALMRSLPRLAALGFPLAVGLSRKGFIRSLDPLAGAPSERLGGSIALALAAAHAGAAMLRVHDVGQTRQALAVAAALND